MLANPVLHKELLMRMRFGRQPTAQRVGICIAIFLLIGFIYFKVYELFSHHPSADDGHSLWGWVMCLQYTFIVLLSPIAAANAITQEREQKTWEMLIFTRLSPGEIIIGKLLSRLLTVVFVILVGLPIALFAAYFADKNGPGSSSFISPLQFCIVYLTQLLTGLFFVTFGLFMSCILKRTLYAVMASYTFVIAGLIMGTLLITTILSSLIGTYEFLTKCPLMWLNPIQLIKEAISPDTHLESGYLMCGLVGYVLLTVLMLWRMIAGFRRFSYES